MFSGRLVDIFWKDRVVCTIHESFLEWRDDSAEPALRIPDECDEADIETAAFAVYGIPPRHPRPAALDVLRAMNAPDEAYATLDAALFDRGNFCVYMYVPHIAFASRKLPKTWSVVKDMRIGDDGSCTQRHPELWTPIIRKPVKTLTRTQLLDMLGIEDASTETIRELRDRLAGREQDLKLLADRVAGDVEEVYRAAEQTSRDNKWGDWTLGSCGNVIGLGHAVDGDVLPPRVRMRDNVTHLTRDQAQEYRHRLYEIMYDAPPRLGSFQCGSN